MRSPRTSPPSLLDQLVAGVDGEALEAELGEHGGQEAERAALGPADGVAAGVDGAAEDPGGAEGDGGAGEGQAGDEQGAQEGGDVLGVVGVAPLGAVEEEGLGVLVGLLLGRVGRRVGDARQLARRARQVDVVQVEEQRGGADRQEVAVRSGGGSGVSGSGLFSCRRGPSHLVACTALPVLWFVEALGWV